MSIPAAVTTATVHHDAPISFSGDPGRVMARFTPSATLIWQATGTPLAAFFDAISPDDGAELSIKLPHTNQTGFVDGAGNTLTNWYYSVKIWYFKDGQTISLPTRDFQIQQGQTSVDLALIPTGTAAPPPTVAPVSTVTSIEGFTGLVTKAQLLLDRVNNTNDLEKPISTAAQAALDAKVDVSTIRTNLFTNPSFETASGTVNLRTNLSVNPSLELDTSQWAFWVGGSGAATATRETTGGYVGSAFHRVTWTVSQSGTVQSGGSYVDTPVTAGKTYSVKTMLRVSKLRNMRVGIEWANAARDAVVGTNVFSAPFAAAANVWTEGKLENQTAPTGAFYLRITVYPSTTESAWLAGDTLDADAVIVEEGATVGPYFDGANPITNLVGNPSFTTDTAGWVTKGATAPTIARDTTRGWSGTSSLRVTGTSATIAQGVGYSVSGLTIGRQYTMSGYVYIPAGGIDVVSTIANIGYGTATTGQRDQWVRLVMTFTATAVTQQVGFDTNGNAQVGAVYSVDGVQLEQGALATTYLEGQGDFTYAWSGAVNASTSHQQAPGAASAPTATSPYGKSYQSGAWATKANKKSLRITPESNMDSFGQIDIPGVFSPGKTFVISATFRQEAPQTGTIDGRARSILVNDSVTGNRLATATNTAGEQRLTLVYAATGSTNLFRLYNGASAGNGDVWWDDLLVEETATAGDYFDGDTAASGDIRHAWSGAAHASTSTRRRTVESHLPTRLQEQGAPVTDWNMARDSGWYQGYNAVNSPTPTAWFMGTAEAHTANWVTQTVIQFTGDGSTDTQTWRRSSSDSGGTIVWGAWYKLQLGQAEQDARYQAVIAAGTTAQYWRGDKTFQTLDKAAVGLGSVDNTSDVAKPVSTAQQTALNGKAASGHTHNASDINVGTLADARLPMRLGINPADVTDWNAVNITGWYQSPNATNAPEAGVWYMGMVEAHNPLWTTQTLHQFTGDSAPDTKTWRRSSSDVGGVATWGPWYKLQLSQAEQDARYAALAHTHAKADVGLGNVDNTSDLAKPVSTATQTALDAKAPLASPTFTGTVTLPATTSGLTKSNVGLANVDNTSDVAKPVSTAQAAADDARALGMVFRQQVATTSGSIVDAIVSNIPTFTFKANRNYRIVWDFSRYGTGNSDSLFYCNINLAPVADAAASLANLTLLDGRTIGLLTAYALQSTQYDGPLSINYSPGAADVTMQIKFRVMRVVGDDGLYVVGNANERAHYLIFDDGNATL